MVGGDRNMRLDSVVKVYRKVWGIMCMTLKVLRNKTMRLHPKNRIFITAKRKSLFKGVTKELIDFKNRRSYIVCNM